jgi:MFS family permease
MISSPSSAAEAALEDQRIGGLQIRVAALCTLVQMCDGFDINSIAWAVPSLIHVWHLPPPAFTTAFLWSSIGIMVGALSAGPIGDRVGRKPLLLASDGLVGVSRGRRRNVDRSEGGAMKVFVSDLLAARWAGDWMASWGLIAGHST